MQIKLRPYQKEAVGSVIDAFRQGVTRQLLTLPTGSGKTIVMAEIARSLGQRVLFLAHREELITQAVTKFQLVWPGIEYGICMADKNEVGCPVVFGTVQTCSKPSRLHLLKQQKFNLMLIDEAHHALSTSYRKIIEELAFDQDDQSKLLVGVTATPMRSDEQNLGTLFERNVYSISIGNMIHGGCLSPVMGRRLLTSTSLKNVKLNSGDYAIRELSEAINTQDRNQFIVDSYKKHAAGRRSIAFCSDVQHCIDLAKSFQDSNVTSEAIYGSMSSLERKLTLDRFRCGKVDIITSCNVLTEGFDEPSISCVIMARPTKFHGLYIQCVGRGLRTHPSKKDCLVLDFADYDHRLDTTTFLDHVIPEARYYNERSSEEDGEAREKEDKTATITIFRSCDEEFDLLGQSRFIWVAIGDGEWSLADDNGNEAVVSPKQDGYTAQVYWRSGQMQTIIPDPISIEYCTGVCEDFARSNFRMRFAANHSNHSNRNLPPTNDQLDILRRRRIDSTNMTRSEASLKIRERFALDRKLRRNSISSHRKNSLKHYFG